MIARPRLVLRIYLIGLAQVAALAGALWLTRPQRHQGGPSPEAIARLRDGAATLPLPGPHQPPEPAPGLATKLVVLALVLVGISAVLTASWLARPLARLSEAARALGQGRLSTRTGLRRNDELGDVGAAFDEMAGRIEALVRAQSELLANVSHELRTPLARIHVALDLAAEGGAEEAARSLTGIAGDLAEVERLVQDILTSARLELTGEGAQGSAGGTPLRIERVPAALLLDDAAGRFRARHPGRQLILPAPPSALLEADRMLLRRALDNLLDNAARYSDAPVALTAAELQGQLVLEVRDRGQGLSAEDLAKLFTPFFRADRSRARQTGGLGLGLVLARRIVEAHHGSLTIESTLGQGTVARVRVPVATSA